MTCRTRVMLIVSGVAILLGATGCGEQQKKPFVMTQVPGDPPITIGDGSFHAHSVNNWMTDQSSGMTILPNTPSGNAGSFATSNECGSFMEGGKKVNASAFLWTDEDNTYDISPVNAASWSVKVIHNDGNVVLITIVNGYLQFAAQKSGSSFDPPKNDDEYDRRLSPAGKVTEIDVTGAYDNTGWPKASKHHPHYTLGFCYQ